MNGKLGLLSATGLWTDVCAGANGFAVTPPNIGLGCVCSPPVFGANDGGADPAAAKGFDCVLVVVVEEAKGFLITLGVVLFRAPNDFEAKGDSLAIFCASWRFSNYHTLLSIWGQPHP